MQDIGIMSSKPLPRPEKFPTTSASPFRSSDPYFGVNSPMDKFFKWTGETFYGSKLKLIYELMKKSKVRDDDYVRGQKNRVGK